MLRMERKIEPNKMFNVRKNKIMKKIFKKQSIRAMNIS